jgi:hypothetical protein
MKHTQHPDETYIWNAWNIRNSMPQSGAGVAGAELIGGTAATLSFSAQTGLPCRNNQPWCLEKFELTLSCQRSLEGSNDHPSREQRSTNDACRCISRSSHKLPTSVLLSSHSTCTDPHRVSTWPHALSCADPWKGRVRAHLTQLHASFFFLVITPSRTHRSTGWSGWMDGCLPPNITVIIRV